MHHQNRFRLSATFVFCLFSSTACGGGGAGSDAPSPTSTDAPAVSATPSPTSAPTPTPSATPTPAPAPGATPAPSPAPTSADAAQARFNGPQGIAVSGNGDVYVVDEQNYTVRKIAADGAVTTVAGAAGQSGSTDGTGSAARFTQPHEIAIDGSGNLYVTDGTVVRKISTAGTVSTIAGTQGQFGNADGIGAAARFHSPQGIVVDASGNLYVADKGDLALDIRKIAPSGSVTTLAGSSDTTGTLPRDGNGTDARFIGPTGLAIDGSGNLYVTDIGMGGLTVGNNGDGSTYIRKVTPSGQGSTVACNSGVGSQNSVETVAQFYNASGIALDGSGNIFVTDHLDHGNRIKKIDSSGNVSVLAISGTGFGNLADIEAASGGAFYASDAANDTIDRISASGSVSVYAGQTGQADSADTP